jgi:hypothetical protein
MEGGTDKVTNETKITEQVPGADEIPSPGTVTKNITWIYLDLVGFGSRSGGVMEW